MVELFGVAPGQAQPSPAQPRGDAGRVSTERWPQIALHDIQFPRFGGPMEKLRPVELGWEARAGRHIPRSGGSMQSSSGSLLRGCGFPGDLLLTGTRFL
jgi:hypothetical protein